ncbi:MAG TPA: hypothetical protein VEB23_04545 [Ramlibacter sp.]|nr:hypothetical protein [Ramlibacter sp.]HYH38605.1 hypothetical protein [Azospirillum sp.]
MDKHGAAKRTLLAKLNRAWKDPTLVTQRIARLYYDLFGRRRFVAVAENRSDSDNGTYIACVERATQNTRAFATFKRHPSYRTVLEHVSQLDGAHYLDCLRQQAPDLLERIDDFKANDSVGHPIVYDYPGIGRISPTTLRYMKVAADLRHCFGDTPGSHIAEIGVGYGGQLLVLDRVCSFTEYDLFDLPPVLDLVERYLECHILNCGYRTCTINRHAGQGAYDLVISNYAFSELPEHLQRQYIRKVIGQARRGYLTMNSGRDGHGGTTRKLAMDQLRELLPPFEVFEETPCTAAGNYLILWGHARAPIS